jgi:F-type H+-transporting ATPase subunit a
MTIAKRIVSLILLLFLSISSIALAAPEKASNRVDIMDKLSNHYYLDFKPIGKAELPRILFYDGSFSVFSSTTDALNSSSGWIDQYYLDHPDQISFKDDGRISPASYKLVREDGSSPAIDFSLSSHLIWFAISGFLVLFIFGRMKGNYTNNSKDGLVPKGPFQNIFESLIIFVRDDIALANIGPEKYMKYTPYLLSAFFMILFMNLFGLMPWGVTSTADVMITAVLALFTFVITQFAGTKDYWKHVFAMPGIPKFMLFIMTPVEILGLFTKPFALTVRLFANMSSGKMLVYSILGLIFIFGEIFGPAVGLGSSVIWVLFTVFIYAIKVFASFLQAYIFTMFSALYIGMAAADHEHHHDDAHPHDHHHESAVRVSASH